MRHNCEAVHRSRRGTTLVEVMCAVVLLALMALACGSYIANTRAAVANQRFKRMALEIAGNRLEELRGAAYDSIRPVASNYNWTYVSRTSSNTWRMTAYDPGETVSTNGRVFPLTTLMRYEDLDGWAASFDYLRIRVLAGYRDGVPDRITLETCYAP